MSVDASIELDWGGETRRFRLGIGQLRELQEAVNRPRAAIGAPLIGPRALLRVLGDGDAWPDEVREVIRLGLIGGGATPIAEVPALVRRYVDGRPLLESTQVAQAVLLVALVGVPDDQVGKKPQAEPAATMTTDRSASPSSTAPVPRSDSRPTPSTACPSGSSPPASTASIAPTAAATSPTP